MYIMYMMVLERTAHFASYDSRIFKGKLITTQCYINAIFFVKAQYNQIWKLAKTLCYNFAWDPLIQRIIDHSHKCRGYPQICIQNLIPSYGWNSELSQKMFCSAHKIKKILKQFIFPTRLINFRLIESLVFFVIQSWIPLEKWERQDIFNFDVNWRLIFYTRKLERIWNVSSNHHARAPRQIHKTFSVWYMRNCDL